MRLHLSFKFTFLMPVGELLSAVYQGRICCLCALVGFENDYQKCDSYFSAYCVVHFYAFQNFGKAHLSVLQNASRFKVPIGDSHQTFF